MVVAFCFGGRSNCFVDIYSLGNRKIRRMIFKKIIELVKRCLKFARLHLRSLSLHRFSLFGHG
ncbi:hypothetical protein BURPS1106B_A0053 [Burkholderia pseudomallei 1106b]|uniref:Uncharacterized protein n=1 Tax=Burkholderia pseudomallei (strain 1106a) TaxID=357348 RepID=A3NRW2_BURP0|nr:hypothetical protein BURPS1106A_0801 [Burkholderia pseudomallei 1106a]EES25804.1 hypothetical protein BURPS1106B_A0053 [Burkholderia pseudomallei 1106b]